MILTLAFTSVASAGTFAITFSDAGRLPGANVNEGKYYPYFHNIRFENVTSQKSRYVLHVEGLENRVQAEDISFKNCRFDGVTEQEVCHVVGTGKISYKNVYVNGQLWK